MTTEDMAVKLAEVDQRAKSNTRRVEKLETQTEAIQSLATSVEVMVKEQVHQTEAMARIEQNVEKLDGKVEALEQKPAKRWDGLVTAAIGALAGLLIGFIGAALGLA